MAIVSRLLTHEGMLLGVIASGLLIGLSGSTTWAVLWLLGLLVAGVLAGRGGPRRHGSGPGDGGGNGDGGNGGGGFTPSRGPHPSSPGGTKG